MALEKKRSYVIVSHKVLVKPLKKGIAALCEICTRDTLSRTILVDLLACSGIYRKIDNMPHCVLRAAELRDYIDVLIGALLHKLTVHLFQCSNI